MNKQQQNRDQPSYMTIFSLTNSIMGTSSLVLPLLFQQSGIVLSISLLLIKMLVSRMTCSLLFQHYRESDGTLNNMIIRILGYKYQVSYVISSIGVMYFSSVVYFLFSCNTIYDLIEMVNHKRQLNIVLTTKNTLNYQTFGYQYLGFMISSFTFIVLQVKQLKYLIKAGTIGIVSLMIYVLYLMIMSFYNPRLSQSSIKLSSYNVSNTLGALTTSYFVQAMVIPIFNNNRHQHHNKRDLWLGFILAFCLYVMMGSFGYLAIHNRPLDYQPQTVLDYLKDYDLTMIPLVFVTIQLQIGLPVLFFLAKQVFFQLILDDQQPTYWQNQMANIIFMTNCLVLQQFNIDITLIIALVGSVCAYWMIYVLPIIIHLKSIYTNHNSLSIQLVHIHHPNHKHNHNQYISNDQSQNIKRSKLLTFSIYISIVIFGSMGIIVKIIDILGPLFK